MRYTYNKENSLYKKADIAFEDDNSISYKTKANDIANMQKMKEIYVSLNYQDVRKNNINIVFIKVQKKLKEILNDESFNLLMNNYKSYVKKDVKRTLKIIKPQIKNFDSKDRKELEMQYNVVNIIYRLNEDINNERVA